MLKPPDNNQGIWSLPSSPKSERPDNLRPKASSFTSKLGIKVENDKSGGGNSKGSSKSSSNKNIDKIGSFHGLNEIDTDTCEEPVVNSRGRANSYIDMNSGQSKSSGN